MDATKKQSDFDPENWEPVTAGPTWRKSPDGKSYVLPELTLGWELAEFAARWLKITDPDTGEYGPFLFTPEQLRFALWFYAIDREGRFLYRRALLQRLKGWGKDPFAAALSLFEAVGNCRLKEILEDGTVVGRQVRDAYVQIAAVSLDQTRNTSDLFKSLLTEEAIDHFNFNLGMEVQYARGGLSQIHCVTSSPLALEGKRPTFLIANETQNWVASNRGSSMYRVMKGNLTKHPDQCHWLIIANAPIPGEGSVSESLIRAYEDTLAGKSDDRDLMYDTLEAPANAPVDDRDVIAAIVEVVRGDSVWLPIEPVVGDFFDSLMPVSETRRKWFNQVVADSDAIYSRQHLLATRREAQLLPGDEIVLGFDGGRTDDSTALIAIRIRDRVVIPIRIWEKPRTAGDDWIIDHDSVNSAVHDTFGRYNVKAFFADVNLWESWILDWSNEYGEVLEVRASDHSAVAWDMRRVKLSTEAHMRLVSAIQNERLFHNGDAILMQHFGNTRKRYNIHGLSFGKESRESSRKVDAYAATMLAFEALNKYLNALTVRPQKKKRSGRTAFF